MVTQPKPDAVPPISVITATMATFRPERRETLQQIWEDLRSQTYQDWEWLIVTDGPEGALAGWVDRLDDARVRLLGTPESHHRFKALGMQYAGYVQKAEGVRRARGELIVQVDDDNRIYSTYL